MPTICVYLGANQGNDPKFKESVIALGEEISEMGIDLVYGGSSLGLMGTLANTVLTNGGNVYGFITSDLLSKEEPIIGLTELVVVDSMSERKRLMAERADSFLVFPGGIGTLEEAFETLNAIKIGLMDKQIGFLNVDGYFDSLFGFLQTSSNFGFIKEKDLKIPLLDENISNLVSSLTKCIESSIQDDCKNQSFSPL